MTGLILGKFMPLHKGHLAMIDFALTKVDFLYILLCVNPTELIVGSLRKKWLDAHFQSVKNIKICYTDADLPNSSVSSREISLAWAKYMKPLFPDVDAIITSEKYGDYVAEYMQIEHILFDEERKETAISATMIRENPFRYWDFIPDVVRPFYTKKICLYGAESTGKSTLSEKLARTFDTVFVQEMGRIVIKKTAECTYEDIFLTAEAHAQEIEKELIHANKLLFCDTDLCLTKVYSQYLFGKTPNFPNWIKQDNDMDLYLLMDDDCPYIQDGTRLGETTRADLQARFEQALKELKKPFVKISGNNWEEREQKAEDAVRSFFDL